MTCLVSFQGGSLLLIFSERYAILEMKSEFMTDRVYPVFFYGTLLDGLNKP